MLNAAAAAFKWCVVFPRHTGIIRRRLYFGPNLEPQSATTHGMPHDSCSLLLNHSKPCGEAMRGARLLGWNFFVIFIGRGASGSLGEGDIRLVSQLKVITFAMIGMGPLDIWEG